MTPQIPDELVTRTREWLRDVGIKFFQKLIEEHGKINCCYPEPGAPKIPHSVHFREGMQVRNFMRGTGLCDGWSDHDYDDLWIPLIEKVLATENAHG